MSLSNLEPSSLPNEHHDHHPLHPQLPQTTSLSSQPSLRSLPSLNPRTNSLQLPSFLYTNLTTLKSHSSFVTALTTKGNSLYSGSSDQQIKLWSLKPSPNTSTIASTDSPIKSLVLSGNTLFSSHLDCKIRVWSIEKHKDLQLHQCYKLKAVLPTPKDRLLSLFSPAKYVQVRRHKKSTWVHHLDAVSALAVSHDASSLYSVSWDRSMKIWRTSDFKCMESIPNAHHDAINAIVVSKDGFVYTGSADTEIRLWKQQQGKNSAKCKHVMLQKLERHRSVVNTLALSEDGLVLYSGACDRSVVVWEGGGGRMSAVGALRGHTKAILCLGVVGELVCSGSADKSVRVWKRDGIERSSYSCLAVLEGHGGPVKSLAMVRSFEEEENCGGGGCVLVFSGGLDNDIKVWKLFDCV